MKNLLRKKWRLILLAVTGVASALAIAALLHVRLTVMSENRAAEAAVGQALIAVKRNDAKSLHRMLYSRAVWYRGTLHRPRVFRRYVSDLRWYWSLDDIPDHGFLRTVKARRDVDRAMIGKILQEGVNEPMTGDWPTWDRDKPVLVTYSVRGVPMVSVALREKGIWKIGGSPLYLSAKVLDYGSITDARVAGEAGAVPPGRRK
ncbi:MAG: hypothetical protein Q7T82_04225 [Armatimonadota bacterium]|nr:hypothetical protein [Armatimonadota bacterium]